MRMRWKQTELPRPQHLPLTISCCLTIPWTVSCEPPVPGTTTNVVTIASPFATPRLRLFVQLISATETLTQAVELRHVETSMGGGRNERNTSSGGNSYIVGYTNGSRSGIRAMRTTKPVHTHAGVIFRASSVSSRRTGSRRHFACVECFAD